MNKPEKPEVKKVQASEARQRLPDLLNRVYQGRTRIVVERSGIPVAAIVSVDELQQLETLDEQRDELWALMQRGFLTRNPCPLKAAIDAAGQACSESSGTSSAAPRNRLPPRGTRRSADSRR